MSSMDLEQPEEEWDWRSKGNSVKKKILQKGTWIGHRPIEGSKCAIIIDNVEGPWGSDLKTTEKIEFTIGTGDSILEGNLERCLFTMDKGELSRLDLGNTKCNVFLIDFSAPEIPCHLYNLEESIKAAKEHKEHGVEHFKNGKIIEAYSRFKRAIRLLIFARKEEENVLPLYLAVCNNIALCHLKLFRPECGIRVCTKVLEHEKNNVKALLRRSACYNLVRDFEKAHLDLEKVLELEPNNPTAKEMMPPIKADIIDMNKRYKNMVKKMFPY